MIEERRELLDCTAQLHKRIAELEAENKALNRKEWLLKEANKPQVGVWCWQGDGEDYLESLTCPVLISAEDMRKVVLAKEKAEAACAEMQTQMCKRGPRDRSGHSDDPWCGCSWCHALSSDVGKGWCSPEEKAKLEAACAALRCAFSKVGCLDPSENGDSCGECVSCKSKSSAIGQPILDRMRAMEEILDEVCKDTLGHQPPCPPNCPRCRWEVLKQSSL